MFAAIFTFSAAGSGVRLWLLQRSARPLREDAKHAAEERIAALRERIASAEARAAEANRAAAEANEKAEQERLARVKLEARLAPRAMSLAQHEVALHAALLPFAGTQFWVITQTAEDRDPGTEQMQFAALLSEVLVRAGWIKERYSEWTVSKTALPLFRRVSGRGVEVGYQNGDVGTLRAAAALASGLSAANVDSVATTPFTDILAGLVIDVGLR